MSETSRTLHLIPQPNEILRQAGSYRLEGGLPIYIHSAELAELAGYAVDELFNRQAYLERGKKGKGLHLIINEDQQAPNESYQLHIGAEAISVSAPAIAGLFYGLQTLEQIMYQAGAELPQLIISDAPHFSYRGMHLDVSRHFMPVEFVKRYIDLIALHKMNTFHWHLTDDQGWRIESKRYPRLTEIGAWRKQTVIGHTSNVNGTMDNTPHGGFYTQQEIKDVVDYAAKRQISVIPEIDVPGHAAALLAAYPELACNPRDFSVQGRFGIFTDVLCNKESTFEFLENILTEVVELFPGEYIHIGGDEVKKAQWQDCDFCTGLLKEKGATDYNVLHSYFVERVEAIANKLGKKIIGWDELLDGDVDSSTTIMSWRGIEGGKQAAIKGHNVVMTPVDAVYFDFYQSTSLDEPMAIHGLTPLKKVYGYHPVPDGLSEQQQQYILGAQGNVWTEYMPTPEDVERMVLPRMTALSEVLWTAPDNKDWRSFQSRLPTFLKEIKAKAYTVSDAYKKVSASTEVQGSNIAVTLSTDDPVLDIYYTLDGTQPTAQSSIYKQPLLCGQHTTLRAAGFNKAEGLLYGDERITLIPHKALGKPVKLSGSDQQGSLIVNGMIASDRIFQFHEWLAIGEKGLETIIDLEADTVLSSVELAYQAGQYRHLYLPTAIKVAASANGSDWSTLVEVDKTAIELASPRIALSFNQITARYVRVVVENTNRAYSEEDRKIIAMPVYIDEIIIQ